MPGSPSIPKIPDPVILHLDPHLLVVNKPAGALSFPGRGDAPLLADLLRNLKLVPEDEPCSVVHRLDRDTSGVLVYARTPQARQNLAVQFRRRTVEKVYLALVKGIVDRDGEVNLPLRAVATRTRAAIAPPGTGKPAITRYRVVERLAGYTLIECRPLTGRLHQIRVHMAAVGHPLAVDPLYGGASALWLSQLKAGYRASRHHDEHPLIGRLTLHAAALSIDHPESGVRQLFEAPLPKDFRAAVNQLGRLRRS